MSLRPVADLSPMRFMEISIYHVRPIVLELPVSRPLTLKGLRGAYRWRSGEHFPTLRQT
jgi:hypothetical protein